MKKQIAITALTLATAFGTAHAETINVGMSGGYFPFTFVKLDELQGFEVDVINAIAEETGDEVNFVTMSFSGLIGALESGRIDTIANQITITPEREQKFAFSQPPSQTRSPSRPNASRNSLFLSRMSTMAHRSWSNAAMRTPSNPPLI